MVLHYAISAETYFHDVTLKVDQFSWTPAPFEASICIDLSQVSIIFPIVCVFNVQASFDTCLAVFLSFSVSRLCPGFLLPDGPKFIYIQK